MQGRGTTTGTTGATLMVNGNNPSVWTLGTPWNDNLGASFVHGGTTETIYSTSTVDTTVAGTTTIDYWATYYQDPAVPSSVVIVHATRDVVVVDTNADTEAPVITLSGMNPTAVSVGETYTDAGATVTDNHDTGLSYLVSVDGGATTTPDQLTIDTSATSTHSVLYSATDAAGNTGTATRTVQVVQP
jgi:hypothetical protein